MNSFSDANWGRRARNWAEMTAKISDGRWDCIIKDSSAFNVAGKDGGEGAAGGEDADGESPTAIVFDWYASIFWAYYLASKLMDSHSHTDKVTDWPVSSFLRLSL